MPRHGQAAWPSRSSSGRRWRRLVRRRFRTVFSYNLPTFTRSCLASDSQGPFQHPAQFTMFHVIGNFSVMDNGDLAGLLGNNNYMAVGQFRKTQGCPMTCPEALGDVRIL